MKKIKTFAYLMIVSLLASCAMTNNAMNKPKYRSIKQVEKYRIYGRSAVQSPDFSGQVTLNFEQTRNGYINLSIAGALGKGRTEIAITPEKTTLVMDNRTYHGDDPDALFKQVTNIDWPVSGTINWLKGLPNYNKTAIHYDETNRPLSFLEDGWQVRYQEWMNINGLTLPKRITITRGEVRLRLFIENWEI